MRKTELESLLHNAIQSKELKDWLAFQTRYETECSALIISKDISDWVNISCNIVFGRLYPADFILNHNKIKPLWNYLISQSELQVFDGTHYLNSGDGTSIVGFHALFLWLVETAYKKSTEFAATCLINFVSSKNIPSFQFVVIGGLIANKEIVLDEDTKIIPYSLMPECGARKRFPPYQNATCSFSLGEFHISVNAVIVITKHFLYPKFYREDQPPDFSGFSDSNKKHLKICKLLTLIGPSAPNLIYSYSCLESWVPCSDQMFGGLGYLSGGPKIQDAFSRHEKNDVVLDNFEDEIRFIIANYDRLDPDIKEYIDIPISRLNQAIFPSFSRDLVDKAIDLGIALEALLLTKNDKEENTFKFCLRGALLLGKTEFDKKEIRDRLKRIYNYRSSAVHNGKLILKDITKEDLKIGFVYCREIIRLFQHYKE